MVELSRVFEQTLKHKGFFNFNDLYNFCYEWLTDKNYFIIEKSYTEKLSSFGKEIVIEWTAKKKVTDYFRNVISMRWQIIGLNDAEVEINGSKQKTNKGDLKINFKGDLEKDYENRWVDRPIWKFLRGVYDKYIIRTTTDEYEDRLIGQIDGFFNQVKSFLALEGKK